jgi:hypothetical protein
LLEKGGVQLDQLCEKLRNIEQSQGRKGYPKYNKKKEGQLDLPHTSFA